MSDEHRRMLAKIASHPLRRQNQGPKPVGSLFAEFLQIEAEDARDSGSELGFAARCLIPATLPYKQVKESTYTRRTEEYTLSLLAHPDHGLPYGRYPRLLIAFLVTEAVRTKEPQIPLGRSAARFMEQLGVPVSGGRTGTARRFRDQMMRLFNTTFSLTRNEIDRHDGMGMRVSKKHSLWWDATQPAEPSLFEDSYVMLSRDFFDEIVDRPVPIDLRALRVLQSPLALDLYAWLTYRMFALGMSGKTLTVPWVGLHAQFGSQSARARDFKREVARALGQVLEIYPEAKVEVENEGLRLYPSPTHVRRRLSA